VLNDEPIEYSYRPAAFISESVIKNVEINEINIYLLGCSTLNISFDKF
jgi:hypothetical protein